MTAIIPRPHRLPPNLLELFYRGGERIASFHADAVPGGRAGLPDDVSRRPEEWLGSTVARSGSDGVGLTDLGPLGLLRALVADDPDVWLGPAHVARWGMSPALLVKLLDAGQRLPVHAHPDRRFAAEHLGCPFGKTEAWVVLDVPPGGGTVFVGTRRPVRRAEWAELVDAQAGDAMLDLLCPLVVNVGDGVVVPASTPHCIDAGVFVVELQEPTDFSLLMEWDGFDIDGRADGHLGLGFDLALGAVRNDALERRRTRPSHPPGGNAGRRDERGPVGRLAPTAAARLRRSLFPRLGGRRDRWAHHRPGGVLRRRGHGRRGNAVLGR